MEPTGRPARRRTVPGGFSLIELVLVVTIIAVVAGIAIPRYSGWQFRYRADAAARRIAADLTFAQTRARAASASQALAFDLAANTYQLPGVPDIDRPAVDYKVDLSRSPYCATLVSANFGGVATATFDGYGVPTAGGTVVVQSGPVTKTVTLDAGTATVTVQ